MAYTIKGLAKANECETHDSFGLALVWNYWLDCNSNDQQCVNDFKRLRKSERKEIMKFLRSEFPILAGHILDHVEF